MSTIDAASAPNATPAGSARSTAPGAGKDDGFSRVLDTVARQPGQNGSGGEAGNDAPSQDADTGHSGSPLMRIGSGQDSPGGHHGPASSDDASGNALKITTPLSRGARQATEGSANGDAQGGTVASSADRLTASLEAATNLQRPHGSKLPTSRAPSRADGVSPGGNIDASAADTADSLTRLLGLTEETASGAGRQADALPANRPATDEDRLFSDEASPQPAGDGRDTPATGADELTHLLGFNATSMGGAQGARETNSRTALRHPSSQQLPGAAISEATAEQPRTARIIVIGRETHFAPVNLPAASDHGTALSPVTTALPTEAGRQQADEPGIRQAEPALADIRPGIEKIRDNTQRTSQPASALGDGDDLLPAGTQTGDVQTASVSDDAGAGPLVRIADQIVAQARDLTAPAGSSATAAQAQHMNGPVRILRLQLQPEELGLVTARLRIVAGVLELRLTVDRQQSVEVLKQDRDGLLEALRRAGYTAEIASIEFARPPASAPQAPANPSGQSFAQGFTGENGGGASNNAGQTPDQHNKREDADRRAPDEQGSSATPTLRSDDAQAIYL